VIRRLVILGLVGAALAAPSPAQAKGFLTSLKVCGEGGCAAVQLPPQARGEGGLGMLMDGALAPAPKPGAFYRLKMRGEVWNDGPSWYSPAEGGIVSLDQGGWQRPAPRLRMAVRAAAAGLDPHRFTLAAVRVAGRPSRDPAAFQPLVEGLPASSVDVNGLALRRNQWVPIRLTPAGATPWGTFTGFYDPVSRAVDLRFATWGLMSWAQVPPVLAARIENEAGLSRPGRSHDDREAVAAGAALLAAVAAVAAAIGLRRSRHRGQPRPLGSA
jgi:hypothetical protein